MDDNKDLQNIAEKDLQEKADGGTSPAKAVSEVGSRIGDMLKGIKLPAGGGSKKDDSLDDDLRRLTRTELLEMLIDETKEGDRLRAENERLREELSQCKADLNKTASLDIVIARLERIVREASR